jgi:hypothetical protein
MASILELYNRIDKLKVDDIVEDTMTDASPMLRDKQRGQMSDGLNAEGDKIGRYRNPAYARMKNSMNPKPGFGTPDLKLTGAFYKDIYTEVRGDKLIIDSVNEKTQALAEKYSEKIFGLNKETKADAIVELKPIFIDRMKTETGL